MEQGVKHYSEIDQFLRHSRKSSFPSVIDILFFIRFNSPKFVTGYCIPFRADPKYGLDKSRIKLAADLPVVRFPPQRDLTIKYFVKTNSSRPHSHSFSGSLIYGHAPYSGEVAFLYPQ